VEEAKKIDELLNSTGPSARKPPTLKSQADTATDVSKFISKFRLIYR
jgi:hypothetical protein